MLARWNISLGLCLLGAGVVSIAVRYAPAGDGYAIVAVAVLVALAAAHLAVARARDDARMVRAISGLLLAVALPLGFLAVAGLLGWGVGDDPLAGGLENFGGSTDAIDRALDAVTVATGAAFAASGIAAVGLLFATEYARWIVPAAAYLIAGVLAIAVSLVPDHTQEIVGAVSVVALGGLWLAWEWIDDSDARHNIVLVVPLVLATLAAVVAPASEVASFALVLLFALAVGALAVVSPAFGTALWAVFGLTALSSAAVATGPGAIAAVVGIGLALVLASARRNGGTVAADEERVVDHAASFLPD